LAVSKIFRNFAAMNEKSHIITALNRLTHRREAISLPMGEDQAKARLDLELKNRRYQHHQPHTRLRVERVQPTQLKIPFNYE
jgi:hypothetical protein